MESNLRCQMTGQVGSGSVQLAPIPPRRISFVSPGETGDFALTAAWPASVRASTVLVTYTCNNGVTGSLSATINR